MLILEEKLLIFVEQEASQDADVSSCVDKTSNVKLLINVFCSSLLHTQGPIPSAYARAAEKAFKPSYLMIDNQAGFLVHALYVLLV